MTEPFRYPNEAFFRDPVRAGAQISADGTRLAYVAPDGGRLNVWVQPIDRDDEAVCVTRDYNRGIRSFMFTADPRYMLYMQDDNGDENVHIFRIDLEDSSRTGVDLTPFFPHVTMGAIDLLASDPQLALITLNKRDPHTFDVYTLNIDTGELVMIAENPGNIARWVLSPAGKLFAFTIAPNGDETLNRWDDGTLVPLLTFDGASNVSAGTFTILLCVATPEGDALWVASNRHSDANKLYLVDAQTGEETLLAGDDTLSVDYNAGPPFLHPLIRSRATGGLFAVRYAGPRQTIEVLDPAFQPILDAVSKLHDGDVGNITSDKSLTKWLVTFISDVEPDVTFLYDHSTGDARELYRPYPHLDRERVAKMTPIEFTSRDGLTIHGYLTLPVGVDPVGLPMVLHPHGGPWARDRWMYQPRVHAIANMGYAVLQLNFRGSTGYGGTFIAAGVGEWGGTMHNDLIDGVEWCVKQGYADPSRVCIFGGSYGGYSALAGLVFTPEFFASSIDYVGISDLENFMRKVPHHWRRFQINSFDLHCGDPETEEGRAALRERSPMTYLDRIVRPLLVVHGRQDPRVDISESDNIVAALEARGADVEYLVKDNEGHGFLNPENNVELFGVIEQFLARTIGADAK